MIENTFQISLLKVKKKLKCLKKYRYKKMPIMTHEGNNVIQCFRQTLNGIVLITLIWEKTVG